MEGVRKSLACASARVRRGSLEPSAMKSDPVQKALIAIAASSSGIGGAAGLVAWFGTSIATTGRWSCGVRAAMKWYGCSRTAR